MPGACALAVWSTQQLHTQEMADVFKSLEAEGWRLKPEVCCAEVVAILPHLHAPEACTGACLLLDCTSSTGCHLRDTRTGDMVSA